MNLLKQSQKKSATLPKKSKKSKKKSTEMEELLKAISNYGFPVVMSLYLMIRVEGKIETLTESIRLLTNDLISKENDTSEES